jgi:hypothetical protein
MKQDGFVNCYLYGFYAGEIDLLFRDSLVSFRRMCQLLE